MALVSHSLFQKLTHSGLDERNSSQRVTSDIREAAGENSRATTKRKQVLLTVEVAPKDYMAAIVAPVMAAG